MECEKLRACLFFNDQMESMPAAAELLKTKYCRGTFSDCARFRVASRLGAGGVPKDMSPGDLARAETLLTAAS